MKALFRVSFSLFLAIVILGLGFFVTYVWPVEVGTVFCWTAIVGAVLSSVCLIGAGIHSIIWRGR